MPRIAAVSSRCYWGSERVWRGGSRGEWAGRRVSGRGHQKALSSSHELFHYCQRGAIFDLLGVDLAVPYFGNVNLTLLSVYRRKAFDSPSIGRLNM